MSHSAELLTLTHFDRTTALRRDGEARFHAELDETWSSLRGVHGGYMTALTVRAAEAVEVDRDVRTATASFLRPAEVGPAEISIDVVRSGRSFATVVAELRQHDRLVMTNRITMLGRAAGRSARDWSEAVRDRPAPRQQCVRFTPPPSIRHFENADLLIDPATVPTGDADHARVAGHVRPKERRPLDAAWLVMIGDWFPPSPFRRVDPPIGGVSIDYSIHLHRTVESDPELWLEGVFVARDNADGVALEHGTLAMPDGTPVAETFHTRWTG